MIHVPHLETDITQACQLSCVGCNHSVPLWRKYGPWQTNSQIVRTDLGHLSKVLHAERWGALGGEPTLHRKLPDILKVARDSGIADATEVWTNGLLLTQMQEDFWKSFDILILSIYPGYHTPQSLDWIQKKCEDSHIKFETRDEVRNPNFRTMLEVVPTSPADTKQKFKGCFFRMFSRVVNYGFFFTCCCGPHIPLLIQSKEFGTDGISVRGITEDALRAYLEREEPLGACTVCAGRDTAKPLSWHEQRDPVQWLKESRGVA